MNSLRRSQGRIPHTTVVVNGIKYHSIKEAAYNGHLEMMRHAHNPKERVLTIERQVAYPIFIKGELIFKYLADFVVTYGDNRVEIIDVKSEHTKTDPVYRIKKKAVEAEYAIEIKEVVL